METDHPGLARLVEWLTALPPGPVEATQELNTMLPEAWDAIGGGDATKFEAHKLRRGIADVVWGPPFLEFEIERHGRTVHGSTMAERQGWRVNIETRTATPFNIGYTQVGPRQQPLKTRPIAEEIARLMIGRQDDPRLRWREDGSVQVLIGQILPGDSPAQTTAARRKRFRDQLKTALGESGWHGAMANVYRQGGHR